MISGTCLRFTATTLSNNTTSWTKHDTYIVILMLQSKHSEGVTSNGHRKWLKRSIATLQQFTQMTIMHTRGWMLIIIIIINIINKHLYSSTSSTAISKNHSNRAAIKCRECETLRCAKNAKWLGFFFSPDSNLCSEFKENMSDRSLRPFREKSFPLIISKKRHL